MSGLILGIGLILIGTLGAIWSIVGYFMFSYTDEEMAGLGSTYHEQRIADRMRKRGCSEEEILANYYGDYR